jgi:hypothetical protein
MIHIPFSSHYCSTATEALEICAIINKVAQCQMASFSIDALGNCEVQAYIDNSTMRVIVKRLNKQVVHINRKSTTQESPAIG